MGAQHLNTDDMVDTAAILDGCGSLIRVSAPGNVVELAHFTVQEFLTTIKLRAGAEFQKYHVDEELPLLHMAMACLTLCCLDNFDTENVLSEEELNTESRKYPLRQYAVSSWFDHARPNLHDPRVMALARQPFQPPNLRTSCLGLCDLSPGVAHLSPNWKTTRFFASAIRQHCIGPASYSFLNYASGLLKKAKMPIDLAS
jgi:hypothetical protein